jgi:hypothetical protein
MPIKDNPSQPTAMTAAVLMFEQIGLIADYLKSESDNGNL